MRLLPTTAGLVLLLAVAAGCGGSDDAPDAGAFCAQLDRLTENDPFQAFGPAASGAEIDAAFDALVERADDLATVAPDDARGPAEDFLASARTLRQLLQDADYDGNAVDARAYREAQVTYAEASERLLRYLDASC